jgi:hypothetical protein
MHGKLGEKMDGSSIAQIINSKKERSYRSGGGSTKSMRNERWVLEKRADTAKARIIDILSTLSCNRGQDAAIADGGLSTLKTDVTNSSLKSFSPNACFTISVNKISLVDNMGEAGRYTGSLLKKIARPHGHGTMIYKYSVEEPTSKKIPRASTRLKRIDAAGDVSDQPLLFSEMNDNISTVENGYRIIYSGQWLRGDWTGFGTLTDESTGITYQGGFFDNCKHGLGVITYADGRVYDTSFQFGRMADKGHLTWPNGNKYWGSWNIDGVPHGRGKKQFANGRIFDGEFYKGEVEGHGRMRWSDGSWHLGEWSNEIPNGMGMHVGPAGDLLSQGMFCRGKLIAVSSMKPIDSISSGPLSYRSEYTGGRSLEGPIPEYISTTCRKSRYLCY